MHNRWKIVLAVLLVGVVSCHKKTDLPRGGAIADAPPTTVRVVVVGVESHNGRMLLALFSSADGFPDEPEKAERRLDAEIASDEIVFVLEKVPAGWYAVSILHDENDNNKMETDFYGRPKEGYGFSRNARGHFGPPDFEDAAFEVAGDPLTLRIELTYH
jgi:uncharacterized protein (DUF2141 family)